MVYRILRDLGTDWVVNLVIFWQFSQIFQFFFWFVDSVCLEWVLNLIWRWVKLIFLSCWWVLWWFETICFVTPWDGYWMILSVLDYFFTVRYTSVWTLRLLQIIFYSFPLRFSNGGWRELRQVAWIRDCAFFFIRVPLEAQVPSFFFIRLKDKYWAFRWGCWPILFWIRFCTRDVLAVFWHRREHRIIETNLFWPDRLPWYLGILERQLFIPREWSVWLWVRGGYCRWENRFEYKTLVSLRFSAVETASWILCVCL